MARTQLRWKGLPIAGVLTVNPNASFTWPKGVDRIIVSASADCTLTWRAGSTTDPGAPPATGISVSGVGCRKLLANQRDILEVSNGYTNWAFRQNSGSSVDLIMEAGIASGPSE